MSNEPGATGSMPLRELTRRVVVGQALFTAGHTLTIGGFFNYFVSGFQPTALWQAILQAAPEFFETAGLLTRRMAGRLAGRKRLWIAGLLCGRLAALGIPLVSALGISELAGLDPLLAILACVAVWYACQGISYVAYLSWLSDLAPEPHWGRFFSRRQVAHLVTTLLVYTAAISLRARLVPELDGPGRQRFFAILFTAGGLFAMASVLPLLVAPSVSRPPAPGSSRPFAAIAEALRDVQFRRLIGWSLHLAAFQGLTQAVLTKYQIEVLGISLDGFLVMHAVMLILQTGLSFVAGRISDRFGDLRALIVSSFAVSLAIVFPLIATRDRWYLQFGAYAVWGLFGIVNLCSQTLALRLAPRGDNTLQLSLFRQVSGLLAGLAGLVGGWWLDRLLATAGGAISPYHILFGVSLVGRLTAPFWLLGIRERRPEPNS